MRFLVLLVLASVPYAAAHGQGLKWAGVEIIGAPLADTSELRDAAGVEVGSSVKSDDEARAACQAVSDRLRQLVADKDLYRVNCELVGYSNSRTFLVANVSLNEGASGPAQPPGSLMLDQDLSEMFDDFTAKRAAAVSASKLSTEHIDEKGVSWTAVPDLDAYKSRWMQEVIDRRTYVIECVLRCTRPQDRAASVSLFNWMPFDTDLSGAALAAILDVDPRVRNNASRYLRQRLSLLSIDENLSHELARGAARQMLYPSHGDRNKGLFMLKELRFFAPDAVACALVEVDGELRSLAETSVLPNIRDVAVDLLAAAAIAGKHPACSIALPTSGR